jgi:GNAT superfamily N-acetyltransferase
VDDERGLLRRIDAYLDSAPRPSSRTEGVGPFTLFVNDGPGWPYYARPTPGAQTFTPKDVRAVRERLRALGQPETIEWVVGICPGVGPAASAAGLGVAEHPLMRLPAGMFRPCPPPTGARISIVARDDEDLASTTAVAMVGFANPGAERGPLDRTALREAIAHVDKATLAFTRDRMARGLTVTAVATLEGGPVAVGSHNPLGDATEIVGVATLPPFRRRGLGAAVTSALVEDARARGIELVLLSAGDEAIAHVYARLGFRTVGAVGSAGDDAVADPGGS